MPWFNQEKARDAEVAELRKELKELKSRILSPSETKDLIRVAFRRGLTAKLRQGR